MCSLAPCFAQAPEKTDTAATWVEAEARRLDTRLFQNLDSIAGSLNIPPQAGLRIAQNRAFGVGERLVFNLSYGFFNAGVGIFEIPDTVTVQGSTCFRLVSKAVSNRFVSTFYPVHDILMSTVDAQGLYPLRFEKHLSEGSYRNEYWILFDQNNRKAIWKDTVFAMEQFTQDIISPLYYLRTLPIEPGREISLDCHTDKKQYPLKVIFHTRETVKVKAGKFRCVKVEPVFRTEGLFKKKGRLLVWLTDDEQHLPVKMNSKIYALGSITAELISYTPGKPAQPGDKDKLTP